jgi:NAD(P)-dependent dehydrogenase (short-subunit alcohol dehydrogenase family)
VRKPSPYDRIKNEFGHLDVLFGNAGIAKFSPIEETLEKDFDEVLRTNVTAVFLTVQAALALTQSLRALSQLLMGAGASIILNGSMAATIGTGESSAYAASKAGGAGDVPLARR